MGRWLGGWRGGAEGVGGGELEHIFAIDLSNLNDGRACIAEKSWFLGPGNGQSCHFVREFGEKLG